MKRTWRRKRILTRVQVIPNVYFTEFPKQDVAYGRYNFYRSEIRIRKELSLKWKGIVFLHELGHHIVSLLWGFPVEKWTKKTVGYDKLWRKIIWT